MFVSYHHGNDQYWYVEFNRLFSGTYDLVTNRSLDRAVDDNLKTRYSYWIRWTEDPGTLRFAIEEARNRSEFTSRIDNSRGKIRRNSE